MAVTGGQTRYPHIEDGEPVPWVGQRMTLEEFLGLPEVKPYLEYEDGVVRQKMAAKPVHGSIQSFLATVFNRVAGPMQLGYAMTETRFVAPGWAPVPDVSFYLWKNLNLQDGELPDDFFTPPDIAVEIVSPGQSATELVDKCLHYIALGTVVALVVDPQPRAVLILRAGQPPEVVRGSDSIKVDDVLPGFDVTVTELFGAVAPGSQKAIERAVTTDDA
jgi:Uma2 family endonuclease